MYVKLKEYSLLIFGQVKLISNELFSFLKPYHILSIVLDQLLKISSSKTTTPAQSRNLKISSFKATTPTNSRNC